MAYTKFGIDDAHADFVIPIAIIKILTNKGDDLPANEAVNTMYIRMGGTFNSTIRAAYEDAEGILGTPFGTGATTVDKIRDGGAGAISGIFAQLVRGVTGGTGMLASGGLSGKQQIEFLRRVFMSNFQQVIYRGPQFRMFTLPFVMKPTSKTEAENMIKIIRAFKSAVVPSAGATSVDAAFTALGGTGPFSTAGLSTDQRARFDALYEKFYPDGQLAQDIARQNQSEFQELESLQNQEDIAASFDIIKGGITTASPLTFNYPRTCQFELALYQSKPKTLIKLFKSEPCVIEAVSTDYGSSNKMTFFQDPDYYPTEVTMTLNLKELKFQTIISINDSIAASAGKPEGNLIL